MYMSPESLTDNVYESPVDIWALGCTIVEMITGEHAGTLEAARILGR